jgi:hypothetical protein
VWYTEIFHLVPNSNLYAPFIIIFSHSMPKINNLIIPRNIARIHFVLTFTPVTKLLIFYLHSPDNNEYNDVDDDDGDDDNDDDDADDDDN